MTPKEKKSLQQKEYYKLNKEKIKLKSKNWRKDNPDYHKNYYESNQDKFNEYFNSDKKKEYNELNKQKRIDTSAKWRENNPDSNNSYYIENKESISKQRRIWYKNKIESNPLFKLEKNIRSLIRGSIKKNGFKKTSKTAEILGVTFQEFKEHIEKQFQSWMSWNNYGAYKVGDIRTWNIDHKIPLALAKTEKELIELNHYLNLRPLCSKENLDKSNSTLIL